MLSEHELQEKIADAVRGFRGYVPSLESAIGAVFIGKAMGWEVLYLVHNRSTIKKFEDILKIKFKDEMPANTELSRKHYWWAWSNKFKAFWKIVRGDIKVEGRTEVEQELIDDEDVKRTGR